MDLKSTFEIYMNQKQDSEKLVKYEEVLDF